LTTILKYEAIPEIMKKQQENNKQK
jgi:hypothetical protein